MLIGNEPNPFSGITHVRFRLDAETPVSLKVYSAAGREVATLAEGVLGAGVYARSWNGSDYDERQTPSGVYYYRLEAGGWVETQQMGRMR